MNKVENNDVLSNEITPEEFEKISVELMRYKKNSLSYTLGLLALAFSITAGIIGLNSLKYDFTTLIKIMVNIGVLLFGFLYSEKAKSYNKGGCIGLFVLGIVNFARILWAPLILIGGIESRYGRILDGAKNLAWMDWAGPTARGLMILACLIAAGICFIFASIVGFAKTNKLQKYMDSLKEAR